MNTSSKVVNINLVNSEPISLKTNLDLLLVGTVFLLLILAAGFYVYQNHLLSIQQKTNLLLKNDLEQQSHTMSGYIGNSDSDQAILAKHRRIQSLIDNVESHADILGEINKTVPLDTPIHSIDISGAKVIICGYCNDYEQLKKLVDIIDSSAYITITKTECKQNPGIYELEFILEGVRNKT